VVCAQNHDQIGNRMMGERLCELISFEGCKLAACAVLLSPFVPLLFMGDEYSETAPFQYFVSHSDPELVEGVRRGRREEFSAFQWKGEPPDPQDESTFQRSKLNHCLKNDGRHRTMLQLHKELTRLRKSIPALSSLSKDNMDVIGLEADRILAVRRWNGDSEVLTVFNFDDHEARRFQKVLHGVWHKRFDSSDARWMGNGSSGPSLLDGTQASDIALQPFAVLLFEKETED
jgi:maltooligosyltrehalose trehalohydrolase